MNNYDNNNPNFQSITKHFNNLLINKEIKKVENFTKSWKNMTQDEYNSYQKEAESLMDKYNSILEESKSFIDRLISWEKDNQTFINLIERFAKDNKIFEGINEVERKEISKIINKAKREIMENTSEFSEYSMKINKRYNHLLSFWTGKKVEEFEYYFLEDSWIKSMIMYLKTIEILNQEINKETQLIPSDDSIDKKSHIKSFLARPMIIHMIFSIQKLLILSVVFMLMVLYSLFFDL